MAQPLTVVVSQGQSQHPAKRKLEEQLVAALLAEPGIDVTVIPHLYDLSPRGTGVQALQGIGGNMIVLAWLYPRAAHWILDRHGILGQVGITLLTSEEEEDEEDDEAAEQEDKSRVIDARELPQRTTYCLQLQTASDVSLYLEEIQRIAGEQSTQVVGLMDWIGGAPKPEQAQRFLHPRNDTALGGDDGSSQGNSSSDGNGSSQGNSSSDGNGSAHGNGQQRPATGGEPIRQVQEEADRRWYPVIDYSRCTNCMECIDFCLFGVYGVDRVETILVEQPDNCRKGCPACSRVCPENAIIFPQHKTPAIAGAAVAASSAGLKIHLSQLFGAPNAVDVAARERDEQLLLAGRDAVGLNVGIPKRQGEGTEAPKDDLDDLLDALDESDL